MAIVAYAYYPQHRAHLQGVVGRLARGIEGVQGVWVRAAGTGTALPAPMLGRWTEHVHDGQGWEWGAYQAGLDALRANGWDGPVCFLNDTAGVHYPLPAAELTALRAAALDHTPAASALAGVVQAAPPGLALHGQPIRHWVRSNAFVLSPGALDALEGRLFSARDFEAPAVRPDGTLQWPASVSPALAAYLDRWLLADGKHGWRHHARRNEVPPQLLRDKAGAILLEKRLSAQVVASGGQLLHCGPESQGPWRRLKLRAFFWRRRLAA
jgi:hypothetical protein